MFIWQSDTGLLQSEQLMGWHKGESAYSLAAAQFQRCIGFSFITLLLPASVPDNVFESSGFLCIPFSFGVLIFCSYLTA